MLKRLALALAGLIAASLATVPAQAQGISQKVAVCNPSFTNRCMAPDVNGAIPITGSLTPSGTQSVNVTQVGGNAVTTTLPVSDGGGSLTVDTLQLPTTLGIKTSAASLSIAPSSDGVWPVSQSGTWNITNVSGTVSLPTGAATSALQTTGNTSLSSIDTKLTSPLVVSGNVASNTADSGNPVKVGCVYNATLVALTDGYRGNCVFDLNGNLRVGVQGYSVTDSDGASNTITFIGSGTVQNGGGRGLAVAGRFYNGTNWDRERSIQGSDGTGLGIAGVAWAPQSSANGAILPVVSTALESCRVLKASAGNLYSLAVTIQATSGVLQLFNATSAPADGAVTPIWSMPVLSNGTFGGASWNWNMPLRFSTGATVCFSSATTPFTKTASATAMFSGSIQ